MNQFVMKNDGIDSKYRLMQLVGIQRLGFTCLMFAFRLSLFVDWLLTGENYRYLCLLRCRHSRSK